MSPWHREKKWLHESTHALVNPTTHVNEEDTTPRVHIRSCHPDNVHQRRSNNSASPRTSLSSRQRTSTKNKRLGLTTVIMTTWKTSTFSSDAPTNRRAINYNINSHNNTLKNVFSIYMQLIQIQHIHLNAIFTITTCHGCSSVACVVSALKYPSRHGTIYSAAMPSIHSLKWATTLSFSSL